MNKRAAVAGLLAVLSVPAAAQFSGRRGGRGGDRGDQDSRPGKSEYAEPRVNTLEVTLHELEEDLKLTAEQRPAWNKYVDGVRALGNDVARGRVQRPPQGDVMQRVDRMVDAARNRLTALEDISQAAKTLYAALTPEQQKAADPRFANVMAMPLEAGPGMMGGRGGPPPR